MSVTSLAGSVFPLILLISAWKVCGVWGLEVISDSAFSFEILFGEWTHYWPAGWYLSREPQNLQIKPVWNPFNNRWECFHPWKHSRLVWMGWIRSGWSFKQPQRVEEVPIHCWGVELEMPLPTHSILWLYESEHSDKRKYFHHIRNLEGSSGNVRVNLVTLEALVVLTQLVLMCKLNYIGRRLPSF